MNLTYWLRKTPQPSAVLADDKKIEVPKNARAYRDLTATIKAMDPNKLTCLDKDGNVIRSIVLENEDIDTTKSNATPEMSDLQVFARLLAEGYQHGMTANQPIIDSAMQFVERQSVRLAKAESEIERLRAHIHKQNLQIAELSAAPTPLDESGGVLGAMVAGMVQAQAAGNQIVPSGVSPIKGGVKK
jgi:hypothetical protein